MKHVLNIALMAVVVLGLAMCQRRPKTDPLWLISPIEK